MSVLKTANDLHDKSGIAAMLGVKALQSGRDPLGYFERSALYRAQYYEFRATAEIVRPLEDERYDFAVTSPWDGRL